MKWWLWCMRSLKGRAEVCRCPGLQAEVKVSREQYWRRQGLADLSVS